MSLFNSAKKPAVPIRGIHFDLKGVPPTPKRLLELLEIMSAAKLNCALMEWEDTYPWSKYPELRNETAYSKATVNKFFKRAEELSIQVIPLVQCYGHMENVLIQKRFKHLREVEDNPSELCPCKPESGKLIMDMIEDVLKTHHGRITHFHLGGDEAWAMGTCPECHKIVEKHGKAHLYLQHVTPMLEALNEKGITPILWDDMMREWPAAALQDLAEKAQLMCWSYGDNPFKWLKRKYLTNFQKAGIGVWGGSAFKGADGSRADVPNIERRSKNMLAWAKEASKRDMVGVVATGWSRYNTLVAPCETMEAALDALVIGGAAMWNGELPKDYAEQAQKMLATGKLKELAGDRFNRCQEASRRMSEWKGKLGGMIDVLQRPCAWTGEPERSSPHYEKKTMNQWRRYIDEGEEIGKEWIKAHSGLIPRVWLERYVESRLILPRRITDLIPK